MNCHAAFFMRTLDDDFRHRRLLQRLRHRLTDCHIFVQQLGIFALAREPARVPSAIDAEAQPDRINLLTHGLFL